MATEAVTGYAAAFAGYWARMSRHPAHPATPAWRDRHLAQVHHDLTDALAAYRSRP